MRPAHPQNLARRPAAPDPGAGQFDQFTEFGEVIIRIQLQAHTPAGVRLEFSVTDSGMGIPANRLGQLFTPFTQVDDSITRRFGGTGLGLAICRQLVELMGGQIHATS